MLQIAIRQTTSAILCLACRSSPLHPRPLCTGCRANAGADSPRTGPAAGAAAVRHVGPGLPGSGTHAPAPETDQGLVPWTAAHAAQPDHTFGRQQPAVLQFPAAPHGLPPQCQVQKMPLMNATCLGKIYVSHLPSSAMPANKQYVCPNLGLPMT